MQGLPFCACALPPRVQVACPPNEPRNSQLVLYNPPQFLQPLQEKEKRVVFGGHEWVIEQDWDGTGVASVIWEPVSAALCYDVISCVF